MDSPIVSSEPVLLVIADISGYSRYMTASVRTLAHSQTLITELVEFIIDQVGERLEVTKLEGEPSSSSAGYPANRGAGTKSEPP